MTRSNTLPQNTRFKAAFLPALAVTILAAWGGPAPARADGPPQGELRNCIALAETAPDAALERARAWEGRDGGDRARLCQGMALFHKGDFAEAGKRLEALAPVLGQGDGRATASLLGQAGWAWLRAGDAGRAEAIYTQALEHTPGDVDLLIDRAFARAEAERFWDALTDLDDAIGRDAGRADAYLYRAAAHKALSNLPMALDDVNRALELRPGDGEALVLRGAIKAAAGKPDAAKADWDLVLSREPDSSAARTARTNLMRLNAAEK